MPQHSIAIAGAGIGGLALATALAQDGHSVTLFDQFDAPQPVGSGLVMQPVGLAVLDALGLGEATRTLGARLTRMAGHEARTGRTVLDVTYDRAGNNTHTGLAIHRASLHHTLWHGALDTDVQIVPGAQVTAREGQRLLLADGTRTARFDLLVDAAGAHSQLSPLKSRPLPYGAIWGTVAWPAHTPLPPNELRQCYRRANRMAGVLPLGRMPHDPAPIAALFWSLRTDKIAPWQQTPLDQWQAEATALWPDIAPFIAQITDHSQMTHARYSHGTLRRPYSDGLAHIGDAAHRASPQLGQGANMALLDALALSRAIATGPLSDAPARAAAARRNHIWLYQTLSAAFTPQYQSDSRILPWLRDNALMPLSKTLPLQAILSRLVRGTLATPLGTFTHPPKP